MKNLFAISPVNAYHYITKGKEYEVKVIGSFGPVCLFEIDGDNGEKLTCLEQGCAHLGGEDWIFVRKEAEE